MFEVPRTTFLVRKVELFCATLPYENDEYPHETCMSDLGLAHPTPLIIITLF